MKKQAELKTLTILFSLLVLMPLGLSSAFASFSRQLKDAESDVREENVPPSLSLTEQSFLDQWREAVAKNPTQYDSAVVDLEVIKSFNLEAARIWDALRDCQNDPAHSEIQASVRYLTGELCEPHFKDQSAKIAEQIKTLQSNIEKLSTSTWVGGNQNTSSFELPAAHPFFAQLLLERVALRMSEFEVGWYNMAGNSPHAMDDPRSTDKIKDSPDLGAHAMLNDILLLGYLPMSLGAQKGGLFSCAARAVSSLILDNTPEGRKPPELGWKLALWGVENMTATACPSYEPGKKKGAAPDVNVRWQYLELYQWLGRRYGVKGEGKVYGNHGFNPIPMMYGVRWRGKSTNFVWVAMFPMQVTAAVIDTVLLDQPQKVSIWYTQKP